MKHTLILAVLVMTSILCANNSDYSAPSGSSASLNLEDMAQDFVLETKQLEIPGYPTACNPSIARWGNMLLLSFDAYSGDTTAPDRMGLVWLDDDFNVISAPRILHIKDTWQDPRLVSIGNRLYVVFNGALNTTLRRTFIAEVHYDGVHLFTGAPECLLHFPGERADLGERNWVPFAYFDTLLLTYSVVPHRVLRPLINTQTCEDISSTSSPFIWDWGTPRAGTTALLDGDHYLAFFHSSKIMASVHSQGKPIHHYFMGAYTFDRHPPFAITAMSPFTIIAENFYHGPEYRTIKPLLVVFPCGFIFDAHHIWVVYGKQDHEAWVVKLDKKGLYENLVPVERSVQ